MQLILDADNIHIGKNMSTIEQESINEKFLTDKVIDHLTDDVIMGNKENIQKQENIILDKVEDVVETDKEITVGGAEVLVSNSNVEKTNENVIDTQDMQAVDEVIEDKNIEDNSELKVPQTVENVNKEESLPKQNEAKLLESNKMDVLETELKVETDSDCVNLDKISTVDNTATVTEIDIMEISNEENEMESEKEVDISELSTELNEEKEMDLDKEVDIAETPSELNKVIDIEVNDSADTVVENELGNEVSGTALEDKTQEVKCTEVEHTFVSESKDKNMSEEDEQKGSLENENITTVDLEKHTATENEKCTAIEIEDEDEKTNESTAPMAENAQKIQENADKADGVEIIEEIGKSKEDKTTKMPLEVQPKRICRLSNNLDIFSDEEDDQPEEESPKDDIEPLTEKQCINIDDDDDIMLIDEDSGTKDIKIKDAVLEVEDTNAVNSNIQPLTDNTDLNKTDINIENKQDTEIIEETSPSEAEHKDATPISETTDVPVVETNKKAVDKPEETENIKKPLLPKNFVNTCKKNLADMTRNDLEEFCILKIVESIVDRSNLGEIKTHLKNLTQTMEECKKKCLMLAKQNKDLQVVLKSVQEEQKIGSDVHITPLKITRSVGMQVVMVADKSNNIRKKTINGVAAQTPVPNNNTKQVKNQQNQNSRNQKEKATLSQQIPVPRLVPAPPPAVKTNQTSPNAVVTKQANSPALANGIRNSPPVQKVPEKRPRSLAVTVDLTDDEPPAKLQNVQRGPISQPMRVLTATGPNLIPAQRFNQSMNSPRKVYIPISGPQAQNVRPGQTIMLKTLSGMAPRPRAQTQAHITKVPQNSNSVRFGRGQPNRHPAPLPDAMKQYQPPNWKSLPPAPDLKLSKVENGIVISWKIDGFQEENHEEIASYQLYAYQETSSPPNTALWKKIGDVKALPLPMACTLTQFMAGYKYYFAVRAVDIRSRFGPFSLPGSILLLNKI